MTSLPDALIFDCDGTLALTADLHWRAFAAAFAAQDAEFDYNFYHERGGLARHNLIDEWIAATGAPLERDRLIADSIAFAAELAKSGDLVSPNPPVAALAAAWGAARPSAVGSNGERVVVVATVEGLGLAQTFNTIVALDDVSQPKPAPEMFLLAASRLGVAPARCMVLEDSAQGLAAARAAGIPAIDVREPEGMAQVEAMTALLLAQAAE